MCGGGGGGAGGGVGAKNGILMHMVLLSLEERDSLFLFFLR